MMSFVLLQDNFTFELGILLWHLVDVVVVVLDYFCFAYKLGTVGIKSFKKGGNERCVSNGTSL